MPATAQQGVATNHLVRYCATYFRPSAIIVLVQIILLLHGLGLEPWSI
jgi:hypothetical protein